MTGCVPYSLFSKYVQRASITKRTTMNSQIDVTSMIPLYNTATWRRTFYFRTVKLWNSLDPALKQPRSQGFLRPVPTKRERETGRRKNLGTTVGPQAETDRKAIQELRIESENRAQKFYTDDASLPPPRGKFDSTNQKHYPDLSRDTSSVWNFCARFLDVIWRGNQW